MRRRLVDSAVMKDRAGRLKKARLNAGYDSARRAAEAMGVKYSTYAGHENGSREYGIDDAKRYARMFRVKWEWLMDGKNAVGPKNDLINVNMPLASIPVVGNVQAGTWTEVEEGVEVELKLFVPADNRYPATSQIAFRVEGTSLDKIAQPGSFLICVDIYRSDEGIADNDLVIVERTRFNGQMMERTAKRARKVISGWELWPESNDPNHQEPIRVDEGLEADEVRLAAKVLWIMRQP
jgi:SOS-response transcriptional repressor LexA